MSVNLYTIGKSQGNMEEETSFNSIYTVPFTSPRGLCILSVLPDSLLRKVGHQNDWGLVLNYVYSQTRRT